MIPWNEHNAKKQVFSLFQYSTPKQTIKPRQVSFWSTSFLPWRTSCLNYLTWKEGGNVTQGGQEESEYTGFTRLLVSYNQGQLLNPPSIFCTAVHIRISIFMYLGLDLWRPLCHLELVLNKLMCTYLVNLSFVIGFSSMNLVVNRERYSLS